MKKSGQQIHWTSFLVGCEFAMAFGSLPHILKALLDFAFNTPLNERILFIQVVQREK